MDLLAGVIVRWSEWGLQQHNAPLSYWRSMATIKGAWHSKILPSFSSPLRLSGVSGFEPQARHKNLHKNICFEKVDVFPLMQTFLSNLPSVLFLPCLTLNSAFLSSSFLYILMGKNLIGVMWFYSISLFPIQKYTKGPDTKPLPVKTWVNPLFIIVSSWPSPRGI